MFKKILAVVAAATLPSLAFAAYDPGTGFLGLIAWATIVLSYIFPFILALSVIWIVWYIFRYAVAGGEDDKSKAKTHIIWGIVGLFIMVSIWGLVTILTSTFGLTQGAPTIQGGYFPSQNQGACTNNPASTSATLPYCL